jgi:cold shock CspA family protein
VIGHVKYLKRGSDGEFFGHIVPEGKKVEDKDSQVFFHETDVEAGCKLPEKGAEVEYELIPHCPWIRALWVRPINKRSYAPVSELRKAVAHGD